MKPLYTALLCLLLTASASANNHPGGNAKAAAKAGAVSNANAVSNAAVKDAGNSSNWNSTRSDASNNSSGNATSLNQTYKDTRQTPFAYAPDAVPTAPCIKGYSAGASSPILAGTFGAGKVDKGCDSRETARQFALMHNFVAAAKILCSTDAAKRAHLTMGECFAYEKQQTAQAVSPVALQINNEQPLVQIPAPVVQVLPLVSPVLQQPIVVAPATAKHVKKHPVRGCYRAPAKPAPKDSLPACPKAGEGL